MTDPVEVYLWRIRAGVGVPLDVLNSSERERAARYRHTTHRDRFVSFRSAVRQILGGYLGQPPASLAFTLGERGKPGIGGIEFNLSHAGDFAVLAVARKVPLGIDVEALETARDHDLLAPRVLSRFEQARFVRLPEAERHAAFLRCWTAKEAYVKATGDGLGFDVANITVAFDADPLTWRAIDTRPGDVDRWSLHALEPARGFVGALAIAAPRAAVAWFDYVDAAALSVPPWRD